MGQIVIELLSDSCISSGEVYNSSIDCDVCYDSYGLPFIPAKRLRGCLREAALELKDFGMDIDVTGLFGREGNDRAAFVLGNAKLRDYDLYKRQLQSYSHTEYTHPQTVLNQFTYIRTQTSIEKKGGTAEDTSLRTVRVIKRGLVFEADMDVAPEYEEAIRCCCKNLRSMGVNRTRGMGEVRVEYSSVDRDKVKPGHVDWVEGKAYERLDYKIRLNASILIKSVAGGQTKTIPYIDGAKILGLLAQNLGGEGLLRLQEQGRLVCANAYISDGKVRYTPISASLYGIKNEKEAVRDRAYGAAVELGSREGRQLVQLDGSYVDSDTAKEIKRMTVDTEIRYHHSRPQDKSVGHVMRNNANSQEGGSFYQMESIAEGQEFSGYILGTAEQLKKVYDVLVSKPVQYLGYGKTSEYGETEFTVTALSTKECRSQVRNSFAVKLNAPAILYNENAMYAADEKLLLSYIAAAVKENNGLSELPELEITNRFLKYSTVGGFNATWGLHKPVINTFDAGTTMVLKVKGPGENAAVDIGRMENVFLGERISEGYGEASFYPLPDVYEKSFAEPEVVTEPEEKKTEGALIQAIAAKRAYEHIKEQARESATRIKTNNETFNAVVDNLLMMCRQQDTFEDFKNNYEERFGKNTAEKNAKLETAQTIIPETLSMGNVIKEAKDKYPEAVLTEDEVYKAYVMALLITLKYRVREEKE